MMNTERQETENVVILDCEDLTSSIVTKDTVFGVIHRQLLDKLTEQIRESVRREKQRRGKGSTEQNINDLRKNDNFPLNYYIAGKRGSGKTTFLHQIEEKLKYNDYNDTKIKFLHRYEPSQSFGVPNDLFITVTAAVKTRMRELAHEPDRQKEYNSYRYRFCEEKLDKLDKAIVRFSCERKALSGMSEYRASALSSEDPEMNNNVRKNFRESMKLLCELEGVDAFVLVIDDIDIQTEQCCNVLENLRLYLSNDYLIVLMAGDRENNLEHVREKFFKEYDIEYHRADRQGREARMNSIVSHAAQYFAKLFPVKQQFDLENLNALLDKKKSKEVILRYKKNSENDIIEESLEELLLRIFNAAISTDDLDVEAHVHSFLSLPVRNIIQIIQYWIHNGIYTELDRCESEFSDDAKLGRVEIARLVRTALNRSLHDQLPDLSYNYEALSVGDRQTYYDLLLKLCQETGDFENGYYLIDKDERSQNNTLLAFVLAANFKHHIRDFKDFLSYLLYGPATVTLYGKALEQFKSVEAELRKNLVLTSHEAFKKSFEEYFQIGDWRRASRWARKANMIFGNDPDGYNVHSGVVRIQNSEILKKIEAYMENPTVNTSTFRRAVALIVSMNRSDGRDNNYYLSIYSYLAYILHCVEICDEVYGSDMSPISENKEEELNQDAKQKLLDLTEEYFPIRSCHRPEWQLRVPGDEESSGIIWIMKTIFYNKVQKESTKGDDNTVNEAADSLMDDIVKWYENVKETERKSSNLIDDITPHIMGYLWAELYNSLRTISNLSVHKDEQNDDKLDGLQGDAGEPSVHKDEQKADESKKNNSDNYIKVFNEVMKIFRGYTKLWLPSGRMASSYLKMIYNFPLTKYFNLNGILSDSKRKSKGK